MTISANTANTLFDVGIRKNGDGINNPTKDVSTLTWLPNEIATKVFSPQPLFFAQDDRLCLRMSGPNLWLPGLMDFRIKFRVQFLPRV